MKLGAQADMKNTIKCTTAGNEQCVVCLLPTTVYPLRHALKLEDKQKKVNKNG